MSKIKLPETSGLNTLRINDNFQKIEDELNEKVLYRDNPSGEPNEMHNDLDMNGKRIYNLPKPESEHEPLRRKDVLDAVNATEDARDAANRANSAADRVEQMEEDFQDFLLSSGYQDLGEYEAGLKITARNQVFRKDGELYRASASLELPYTTTGDWATEGYLFVSVGDVVLRQELANPDKGAAMVGYKDGTVSDALDVLPVNFKTFPSLVEALNSGATSVAVPPGVHKVTGGLINSQTISSLVGTGPDCVLDFSDSATGLRFDSEIVQIPNPLTTPRFGNTFIDFPSGMDIQRNDVIVFFNPTDESFSNARTYYCDGFMAEVSEYNSFNGKVNFFGMFPDANLSTMQTYRIRSKPLEISNIKIIPPSAGAALHVYGKSGVRLLNIQGERTSHESFIEVDRCFNVTVRDCGGDSLTANGYVLMIGNTQKFVIDNVSGHSHRHCIALGGRSGPATVPYRDGIISNCILENDSRTGISASDMHGNGVNVNYVNCIIKSHAGLAGRDVGYHNCDIYSRAIINDALAIYGREIVGGIYSITDCRLYISRTEVSNYSVIHLRLPHQRRDFFLNIKNLTIYNNDTPDHTRNLIEVQVTNAADNRKVWIEVDGVAVMGKDFHVGSIVHLRSQDGAASSPSGMDARISVSNERVSAVYFATANHIDPAQVKYRLPKQSGYVTPNTRSAANSSLTDIATVSFQKRYPFKPTATAIPNGPTGVGGRVSIGLIDATLSGASVLGASIGEGYTSTQPLRIDWSVEVNEF